MHLRQDEDGVGYSLGNGGTYRVSICPIDPATDDPDETQKQVLYASWAPGNIHTSNNLIVTAQTPRSVVRGRRYFFMLENISSDPGAHYSSLNVNPNARLGDVADGGVDPSSIDRLFDAENSVPGISWFRGLSLPAMWRGGGFSRFRGTPLTFMLRYGSDFTYFGTCTGIGGRRIQDEEELYGSQRVVRIRWTQPWTGQTDGVFANFHKWGTAGALDVSLKQGTTTLRTASVAASQLSPGIHGTFAVPDKSGSGGPVKWVFAAFSSLQTLTSGVQYTIEFRSPGSPDTNNCIIIAGIVNHQWNNPTFALTKECWKAVGGLGACDYSSNNGSSWVFFSHHSTDTSKVRDADTELPVCVRFVPAL